MKPHHPAKETCEVRLRPETFSIASGGAQNGALKIWLVDAHGHVAMSPPGLVLLAGIDRLLVPALVSTEHATKWGSGLNGEEHAALEEMQRDASDAALRERNPQSMAELATRSQLLREAAEAFVPAYGYEQESVASNVAPAHRAMGANR